jgi:hypothetical protein
MDDKGKRYRHLPKRVKRQYRHVQDIPKHQSYVSPRSSTQIVQVCQDFMVHIIPQALRGPVVADMWQYTSGYVSWFFSVSHLLLIPLVEVAQTLSNRLANEEVIIEEFLLIDCPNTLGIILTLYDMTDERVA